MSSSGNGGKSISTSSLQKARKDSKVSSKSSSLQSSQQSGIVHVSADLPLPVVTKQSRSYSYSSKDVHGHVEQQPSTPQPVAAAFVKLPTPTLSTHLPPSFAARKVHKSPKMSGRLHGKDKASIPTDRAKAVGRTFQKSEEMQHGTVQGTSSSDVELPSVNPVAKAPPGAVRVHRSGKVSTFPHREKTVSSASKGKTKESSSKLAATETPTAKSISGNSDVTESVEFKTGESSQVKDVTVTSRSANSRAAVAGGKRKSKTGRENATGGKSKKPGDGVKHSRRKVTEDCQTSVETKKTLKARKVQTKTPTTSANVREEVAKTNTDTENMLSFVSVPCSEQQSEDLGQRTMEESDDPDTVVNTDVTVQEQDSVLIDEQEVQDVEMTTDPPPESNIQATDVTDVEVMEGTVMTASVSDGEDDDDGTYDLTNLFDEEKQRSAWAEESQQPSKHKKKKKKTKWWERKRKRDKAGEAEEDVEEGETEGKGQKRKKKEARPRPNYFVAIRVSDGEIHEGLEAVQQAVLEQEPNLQPAMIPLINTHITLLVTHLKEEQVDRAKEALRLAKARLNPQFLHPANGLVLTFQGLGTFRNDVVFAKIQESGHLTSLQELAETVQTCFVEKEVHSKNDKGFEPHLTLMKMSRNFGKLRSKGIKKIDPKLYEEFKDHRFGDQTVEGLQLCSMLKKKETDGYYHTEEQVMFGLGLEHILASSIASRAVREALLQLGCKLLEQQAKSNPDAALQTLSDHIARSVIQDAMAELEIEENVKHTEGIVFRTDSLQAKVSELSESMGSALVTKAIQEASCKRNSFDENVIHPGENVEADKGVSTVKEAKNDHLPQSENINGHKVDISKAEMGESLTPTAPQHVGVNGSDGNESSHQLSKMQLKDLSEKLVKEIIEAAMSKIQEAESDSPASKK